MSALYVGVTITTVPWIMTRAVGTEKFLQSGPQDALKAAFAGDIQVVQDHFMDQSMPSKEEVLAFTTAASARWGAFRDEVKVGSPVQDGPDGNNFKISIKLTFESGVVPGVAFLTVGDTQSSQLTDLAVFQPKNTFDSFMLIDQIQIEPTTGEPLQLGSGMGSGRRGGASSESTGVDVKIEGDVKNITVNGSKGNVTVTGSGGKTDDQSEGEAKEGTEEADDVSDDGPDAEKDGDS